MSSAITETAQYLTLRLGAIQAGQVREVLEPSKVIRVPTAPDYMQGVVNVRGKPIPVVDLRLKFGLPGIQETVNTRIVAMELELEPDCEHTVVGGIADSVHDVIELKPSQIGPPPEIAPRWRTDLIQGIARRGDAFSIILNMIAVFSSGELPATADIATEMVRYP